MEDTYVINPSISSFDYFNKPEDCPYNFKKLVVHKDIKELKHLNYFSSLEKIEVDEDNILFSTIEGVLYSKDCRKMLCLPSAYTNKRLVLPHALEELPSDYRFAEGIDVIVFNDNKIDFSKITNFCVATIEVPESNPYYKSVNGVLFSKDMKSLLLFPCGNLYEEYVIPDETVEIGSNAFSSTEKLKSININNVETIHRGFFSFNEIIESITTNPGNDYFTSINGILYQTAKGYYKSFNKEFGNLDENECELSSMDSLVLFKFPGGKNVLSFEVTNNTEVILHGSIQYTKFLKTISIGKSIKQINNSFYHCTISHFYSENERYVVRGGALIDELEHRLIKFEETEEKIISIPENIHNIDSFALSTDEDNPICIRLPKDRTNVIIGENDDDENDENNGFLEDTLYIDETIISEEGIIALEIPSQVKRIEYLDSDLIEGIPYYMISGNKPEFIGGDFSHCKFVAYAPHTYKEDWFVKLYKEDGWEDPEDIIDFDDPNFYVKYLESSDFSFKEDSQQPIEDINTQQSIEECSEENKSIFTRAEIVERIKKMKQEEIPPRNQRMRYGHVSYDFTPTPFTCECCGREGYVCDISSIDHAVEIINERGIDAYVKHICNYCAGITPKKKYNAQTMPKTGKCINVLPNSIEDEDDKHYQLFIRFKDEQKYRKIIQNSTSVYRALATILRNENSFSTAGPFMEEAFATEYIDELSEIIGQDLNKL